MIDRTHRALVGSRRAGQLSVDGVRVAELAASEGWPALGLRGTARGTSRGRAPGWDHGGTHTRTARNASSGGGLHRGSRTTSESVGERLSAGVARGGRRRRPHPRRPAPPTSSDE